MNFTKGNIVKIKDTVEHTVAGKIGYITDIENVFGIDTYIVLQVAMEAHELETPTESEIKIFLEIEKIRGNR